MNLYLDNLIKALEAEAKEERLHLRKLEASGRFRAKIAGSPLKRTLQRLEILRALQKPDSLRSSIP